MSKKFVPNSVLKFYKSETFQKSNPEDQKTIFKLTQHKAAKLENMDSNICNSINTAQNQDIITDFQHVFNSQSIVQTKQQQVNQQNNKPEFRNVFNDGIINSSYHVDQQKRQLTTAEFDLIQLEKGNLQTKKTGESKDQSPNDTNKFTKLFTEILQKNDDSINDYGKNSVHQSTLQKQYSVLQLQANINGIRTESNQILQCQRKLLQIEKKFERQRQFLYRQKFFLQRQNSIKQAKIEMLEKMISEKGQIQIQKSNSYNSTKNRAKQPYHIKSRDSRQDIKKTNGQNFQKIQPFGLYYVKQEFIIQKDKKIEQLLKKIEEMHQKINQKNKIIAELTYNKIRLQTNIQSLQNQIFVLKNRLRIMDNPRIHIKSFQNTIKKTGSTQSPILIVQGSLQKGQKHLNKPLQMQYQQNVNKRLKFLKNNRIQIEQKQRVRKTRTLNNTVHASTSRQFLRLSKSPFNLQNNRLICQNSLLQSKTNDSSSERFLKLTKNKTNVY